MTICVTCVDWFLTGLPPSSVASLHPSIAAEAAIAERIQAERMSLAADPMLRLQMAGGLPGAVQAQAAQAQAAQAHAHAQAVAHAQQQAHTHTHAHAHTHLHLHQPDGLLPPFHPLAGSSSGSSNPPFLPPGLFGGKQPPQVG